MQIEDRGFVCDTTKRPESERVAAFVGLCATSSGSILCPFQIGPTKNAVSSKLLLYRSRDQGRTWRELESRFETRFNGVPGSLSCGEIVEVESGRLLLIATWFDRSDPSRPFFDPLTEGILPSKQLAAFSDSDGDTWSSWHELPTPGLKACSSTGPILKWADGVIAYPFESLKECDDPNPAVHGAWCMISRDRGRTFGSPVLVARHPQNQVHYYWDQRLCVGNTTGEFIGLFWTHDRESKRDLNVHMRKASLFHSTFQSAPILQTNVPGQIAAPLLLEDGRLLAFVVARSRPGTMTLWSSRDGGMNWVENLIVHLHDERAALTQGRENIDYAQYWEDMGKWSFGHPAILSLVDGRILLAYYAGAPNCTSIHWARVNVGERLKAGSAQITGLERA